MSSAKNSEQILLERRTSSYWRVTFDTPPLNIFGPETIPELNEIVTALETEDVKIGAREIAGRRPRFYKRFQEDKTLWLPSL